MRAGYFFELSGEHSSMCATEAIRCAAAEDPLSRPLSSGPGYVVIDIAKDKIDSIAERIALTKHIGEYVGSYDPSDKTWWSDIHLPDGTFAVRCRKFGGMMRNVDSQKLAIGLGKELSKEHTVDLDNPDNVIRVVMSNKLHVFIDEYDVDRENFEERKVGNRPFFSPISLHPKFARALINMAGTKRGDTVLDPFCGTGGIAIEAAMMGFKTVVSDFDLEMVAGTRENMEWYGLDLHDYCVCDVGDVGNVFGKVNRIVTDPPYGRSTHTGGELVESICGRALSSFPDILHEGGSVGLVFPEPLTAPPGLKLSGIEVQKVHRSLSRHYHVFEKC